MNDAPANSNSKGRVAVIAIHGVADQQPRETANAVANLLLSLRRNEDSCHQGSEHTSQARYTSFYEESLRIPTRPVVITPNANPTEPEDQPDYVFMRDRLGKYIGKGPKETYETIRLQGKRLNKRGEPEAEAHIYEMYWGDLSRVGAGFLRIFGDFYQLLFHLPSLGRHTVKLACNEFHDSYAWKCLNWLHISAERLFTVLIPILNLYLLALVFSFLPRHLPYTWQKPIALVVLSMFVAYCVYLGLRKDPDASFWMRLGLLIGGLLLGAELGLTLGLLSPVSHPYLLIFEWIILTFGLLLWVTGRYQRHRPGAKRTGLLVTIVALIVLTYFVIFPRIVVPDQNISLDIIYVSSVLPTVELTYLALGGVSIAFLALQFFALIVGRCAWKKSPAGSRDKAKRAVWTARLSLALPNTLFLVLTLMLWGSLARTATSLLPDCPLYELKSPFTQYFYIFVDPQFTLPACDKPGKPLVDITAAKFLQELITLFATPVFALAMILSLGAGLLAAWGLFPMVWAEVKPPQEPQDQSSEQYRKWLETGKHQGEWLTTGFRFLKGAGWLVIVAMAILIFVGGVWAGIKLFWAEHAEYTESAIYGAAFAKCIEWTSSSLPAAVITCTDVLKSMSGLSSDFIQGFATILVGSAVGLFAFRGRLEKFALGFRSVLDVALDVDNHLREHPSEAAPRARIAARYVSLLRYISNWKHASGEGYQAIIIVAHSQGTVITADLLRFLLQQEDDTFDEELKAFFSQFVGKSLYFFTVGCPLRQLYSLRFPHLYGWAYHLREEDWGEYDSMKHRIDEGQEPDHRALGVTSWVNAFRSGDYVGRWLWRPDACKYQFSPGERAERKRYVTVDAAGARREFCLGPGAHTHYFDETACTVGLEIDKLVRKAVESENFT